MRIRIQFENGKEIVLEDALINNVRRLKVISSDYEDTLDMYAGHIGYFLYLEPPNECEYLDGKSDAQIKKFVENRRIKLDHSSGRTVIIQKNIKHMWMKSWFSWRQIF